jgi:type I restriction enzyme M protein
LARLCRKKFFGIEINDQIARTAKMNMIIHDDGHTNVIASDGLLSDVEMQLKSGTENLNTIHLILLLQIHHFGSSIKQTEKAYLHQYNLGKKDEDWLASTTASGKAALRDSQSTPKFCFWSSAISFWYRTRL